MRFYVYQYVDPTTNLPFYIGKGTGDRMFRHMKETYKTTENKKKYAVIKGLRNKGIEPIVSIISERLSETQAYELEEQLISQYGRRGIDTGGILTNICESNRPPNPSGRIYSEEQKQNMAQSKLGSKNPMFGKVASPETKKKLRVATAGEKNGFYNKSHSETTKQKMSSKAKTREIKRGKKPIVTPSGVYQTLKSFMSYYDLTEKLARSMFSTPNSKITARKAKNNPLLSDSDVGKTYKEIGYYYENI